MTSVPTWCREPKYRDLSTLRCLAEGEAFLVNREALDTAAPTVLLRQFAQATSEALAMVISGLQYAV